MLFNPDPSKPAQEVLISRKNKIRIDPTISLNNIQVERASHHMHLGILPDAKLNFKQHIDTTVLKIDKGMSVIKKPQIQFAMEILNNNLQSFFKAPN